MENSSNEVKDAAAQQPQPAIPDQAGQETAPAQEVWEEAPPQPAMETELSEELTSEAPAQEAQDVTAAQPDDAAPAAADANAAAQPTESEQAALVEAILFAADTPLPAAKVGQVARLPQKAVREAIVTLNQRYEQVGATFRIEEIAGGLQMLTLGKYHDVLERLFRERSDSRLSQAALETLAVIAYRQPVLRADIEAIRGVACGEVLRGLMEKQLIRIDGRAQILGRPLLYGTTRRFLEVFGLGSLEDLPKSEELRMPAQKPAQEPAVAATPPAEATPQENPAEPAAQSDPVQEAPPETAEGVPAPAVEDGNTGAASPGAATNADGIESKTE
jgi:segregation and condensation protein B